MEIKATDLRIGNLINQDNVIIEITRDKVSCLFRGKYYNTFESDEISGIPLTEELLLKIGAKPQSDTPNYHLRIGATFIVLRIQSGKCYAEFGNVYLGEIEFLHRLQNLVHALCNQELTLS